MNLIRDKTNQRTAPIKNAPYSTKEQLLSNMPLYSTKEELPPKMPPTPGVSSHMEVPNQSDPTVTVIMLSLEHMYMEITHILYKQVKSSSLPLDIHPGVVLPGTLKSHCYMGQAG